MKKHTLSTSVDKLTSEHALNSDEILSSVLELVWVSEDNLGEWCAAARIVYNFLDDSLDVSKYGLVSGKPLTLLSRRNQVF